MSVLWPVVGLVVAQRLGELAYARHNTRRLLAQGGIEVGSRHYPAIVALHAAWLIALVATVPAATPANLPLLVVFIALQGVRLWVLASLGRYWTTRVITVPDAPLVCRGPYRFTRHPNYLVVIAEIAVLPLIFGAWQIAAVFSALNLALLTHRIRVENAALASRRAQGAPQASTGA